MNKIYAAEVLALLLTKETVMVQMVQTTDGRDDHILHNLIATLQMI